VVSTGYATDPVLRIIPLEGHCSFIKIAHCELQKFLEKQCDKLRITILLQVHLVKKTAVICVVILLQFAFLFSKCTLFRTLNIAIFEQLENYFIE